VCDLRGTRQALGRLGHHSRFCRHPGVYGVTTSARQHQRQIRQQQLTLDLRRDVLQQQVAQAQSQADAMASVAQKQRVGSRPQEIRVVTSDNTLINPVNAAGASVYPAESFRNLIDPP